MTRRFSIAFFLLLLSLKMMPLGNAQPYIGTAFIDPSIITSEDPTAFDGIVYTGTGNRLMFDRRINGWITLNAYLFNATFTDGLTAEIQVNPEFASVELAAAEAQKYGIEIGRLPTALRNDVETVWIHKGIQPFGGGNKNLLIHTGQGELYAADGFLEEILVHEAAHTSLDAAHAAAPEWIAAQNADPDFISTYARDYPDREDIAESFLAWLAVRHRSDRISSIDFDIINATIPNRIAYFDSQNFEMFPFPDLEPKVLNGHPYHSSYTGSAGALWYRLDTSKVLAKENTSSQLLTFSNLINTAQGINGIAFEIQNMPNAGSLSITDFEFQVSPEGAFDEAANPPSEWQYAPTPSSFSVIPGAPDRVLIKWTEGSIMNRWLRVSVLASSETGLAETETFYIGHLLGETTGPEDGAFTVSFADIMSIRSNVGRTVDASSIVDIDKDGTVSFSDISAMRSNVGAQLRQITVASSSE